jgi:hypothetical protein
MYQGSRWKKNKYLGLQTRLEAPSPSRVDLPMLVSSPNARSVWWWCGGPSTRPFGHGSVPECRRYIYICY